MNAILVMLFLNSQGVVYKQEEILVESFTKCQVMMQSSRTSTRNIQMYCKENLEGQKFKNPLD